MSISRPLFVLLAAALVTACGKDSPTQPSTPPPPAAPTVSGVAITGNQTINRPGGTLALRATATMSDGTSQDVTAAAQWSSSSPAIATVSGGNVAGVANGDVTITASHSGRQGQHQVRVAIPTRANPRVTGGITVTISPEALFLYRARMEYNVQEQDGVWGLNVNFINVQWKDFTGANMGPLTNYNPSKIAEVWGSNHVNPGQTRTVTAGVDYTRAGSSVSIATTISLGDDLGNPFNFSDTFNGQIRFLPTVLRHPYEPETTVILDRERIFDETRP